MKKVLSTFIYLNFITFFLFAQQKEYDAIRIEKAPKIDGVLDEEFWKAIPPINDFIMYDPIEKGTPSQRSEFKIAYDNFAIYIGAVLYDTAPDSILHELGNRDDENLNTDYIRVAFDTYNNQQDAYYFDLTTSGVQIDRKYIDYTYDAVWESATKITSYGWCAEIKIPYSALRFPSTKQQIWGMQLGRGIRRNREYSQWCFTPKNTSSSLKYWGKLVNLYDINAPLRLSLTPYISTVYDHFPVYNSNHNFSYSDALSYNAGADLKYGIDERYTLDLTLLPDFSQVQSDNKVKNLGYNEITYNENRSFFKEGVELFSKNNLFYSRRIGKTPMHKNDVYDWIDSAETITSNPSQTKLLNAFKISGRNNSGLGIGFFNAITDNMYAEVKNNNTGSTRKVLTEPLTNYNITVFDQQLKNNSNLYFINTNVLRNGIFDDANVTATGFSFSDKNNLYAIYGNGALSQKFTDDTSGPNNYLNQLGYTYTIGIYKASGNFRFGGSHQLINETYDTKDLGYLVFGNSSRENLYFSYNTYQTIGFIRNSYNNVNFNFSQNPLNGRITGNGINLNSYFTTLKYITWGVSLYHNPLISYDYYEPRANNRYSRNYRLYYSSLFVSTDYRKPLALNMRVEYGDYTEKFKGKSYGISPSIRYRVNNHLFLIYSFHYNYDAYNVGFAKKINNDTIYYGGRIITTFINTIEGRYMFKNNMSLNLLSRHYWNYGDYKAFYFLHPDGDVILTDQYNENHNYDFNTFTIDLIYTWQFAPGSFLSIAYKNNIEYELNQLQKKYFSNLESLMGQPQQNRFSIKLLYYFDALYLKKLQKKGKQ